LTLDEAKQAAHELLPAPAAAPDAIAPQLRDLNPQAARVKDRDIAMRKLTQVYLSWGRDSLPWTDPRRPAFLVADHVLGGHFYSRLYVALRHDAGDTYGAGTSDTGDIVVGTYAAHTLRAREGRSDQVRS
jgi:predicted Zn-dependent peptidase